MVTQNFDFLNKAQILGRNRNPTKYSPFLFDLGMLSLKNHRKSPGTQLISLGGRNDARAFWVIGNRKFLPITHYPEIPRTLVRGMSLSQSTKEYMLSHYARFGDPGVAVDGQ